MPTVIRTGRKNTALIKVRFMRVGAALLVCFFLNALTLTRFVFLCTANKKHGHHKHRKDHKDSKKHNEGIYFFTILFAFVSYRHRCLVSSTIGGVSIFWVFCILVIVEVKDVLKSKTNFLKQLLFNTVFFKF